MEGEAAGPKEAGIASYIREVMKEGFMGTFYLLPQEGRFYKANLHCHTVISDGDLTPKQVKEEYQKRGYSVVAFTDHNQYRCHWELNDEEFLSIAAFEANIDQFSRYEGDDALRKVYHLNFYDRHPERRIGSGEIAMPQRRYGDLEYINGYIEKMRTEGFLTCYNHPYWSMQTHEDYEGLRGLWAMEIYNHGCELDGLYGFNPQVYDEMLRTGQRLRAVATDDNHNWFDMDSPMCDSFGGFVMIKAEKLEYQTIMDALVKGNFYHSMGPEIYEAYVRDGKLTVKTSPVEKIYVIQEGRGCYKKLAPRGETITEAEFELTGKEGYIRVDIRDEKGLHAGTNAYWMDEIMTL